ncbi:MAG TPA: GNAT family N-acetyltransferase, partial [bacterium]|nr:GNAT family N-acetyltransferase [bacterium]
AAAFTLRHHDIVEIPWASSIRDYDKLCPNMLLYWEVIKHAISSECRRFDFGRCSKESKTFAFKKQWGPEIHPLYWQYPMGQASPVPAVNPKTDGFSPFIRLWQKLPLPVSNRLGPLIAKNLAVF